MLCSALFCETAERTMKTKELLSSNASQQKWTVTPCINNHPKGPCGVWNINLQNTTSLIVSPLSTTHHKVPISNKRNIEVREHCKEGCQETKKEIHFPPTCSCELSCKSQGPKRQTHASKWQLFSLNIFQKAVNTVWRMKRCGPNFGRLLRCILCKELRGKVMPLNLPLNYAMWHFLVEMT